MPTPKPVIVDGRKKCNGCHEWLELEHYKFQRNTPGGKMVPESRCRPCLVVYRKDYEFKRRKLKFEGTRLTSEVFPTIFSAKGERSCGRFYLGLVY